MAAFTITTLEFKKQMAGGTYNLSGGGLAVALYDNIFENNSLYNYPNFSDLSSDEVTDSLGNYSALPLTATTIDNTDNIVKWDGNDVTWNNISVSAYGYSIYRISDGLVIGYVSFDEPKVTVNGSLTIAWNDNGIMNIF